MDDLTVTITALEYVETQPVEQTTLLGATATVDVEIDSFIATIACGTLIGHQRFFRPEVVGNRLNGYALSDGAEAVESIVREAIFGWSPDLTLTPEPVPDADADVKALAATFGFDVTDPVVTSPPVPLDLSEDATDEERQAALDAQQQAQAVVDAADAAATADATAAKTASLRDALAKRLAAIARNGGTDDRITVVWTNDADKQKAALLDAHADRIEAARVFFSPAA